MTKPETPEQMKKWLAQNVGPVDVIVSPIGGKPYLAFIDKATILSRRDNYAQSAIVGGFSPEESITRLFNFIVNTDGPEDDTRFVRVNAHKKPYYRDIYIRPDTLEIS